jgi:DNA polymerase
MNFIQAVKTCTKCGLHATRTNVVIGDGPVPASLVFLGEAPGKLEDLKGVPFVGTAGSYLRTLITLMKAEKKPFHILNVLKCRPPENRDPLPEELLACRPFLEHQLKVIKPKVIIAMGRYAQAFVLGKDPKDVKTTENAGEIFPWNEEETLALLTYHPAFVLRKRNTEIEKAFRKHLSKGIRLAYGK